MTSNLNIKKYEINQATGDVVSVTLNDDRKYFALTEIPAEADSATAVATTGLEAGEYTITLLDADGESIGNITLTVVEE